MSYLANRCIVGFVAVLLCALGVAAPGGPSLAQSATVAMRVANTQAPSEFMNVGLEKFAREIGNRTGGKLQLTVFPGGQLGGEKDLVQGLKLGSVQLYIGGYTPSQYHEAIYIPYLWRDRRHMYKVLKSDLGRQWAERYAKESGLRLVGYMDRGPREITSNKPIRTVDDFRGLKMRVSELPVRIATFRALGANPVPISFPELFTALQQGTVDAQENPLVTIVNSSFFEVQKYLVLSSHILGPYMAWMDDRLWQRLGPDLQKVWIETWEQVAAGVEEQTVKEEEAFVKQLEAKGMKVTRPDLAPFRERVRAVQKEFADKAWGPGVLEQIVSTR